ncbi:CDP-glycerol glycerophosphotransferase family protein [Marinomonas lutimaris]|uniref:CDP-glycerol glycerophosphotransferase family protein n=1 Tax=Marinomonas lutimaris TaxID=2846746 RepID=UPI001CA5EAAC|nr:CDP-glycerol glycerophosphotransferase family protein [Marinomonas lutimaris]
MKDKLLFVPQHMASLREMLLISNALSNGCCIFYMTFTVSDNILSEIKSNGSEVVFVDGLLLRSVEKKKKRNEIIKFLMKLPVLSFFIDFFVMRFLTRSLHSRIEKDIVFFGELVSKYSIKKVILTTDRSTGAELSIAALATRVKLELIVISFAISAGIDSSEKMRKSCFYYYEKNISWNSTLLPNGKIISFFKKFEKKVIESLGVKIDNPWVLGAGFSDCMLVDSIREKERLVEMGGNSDKYFVVGQISHDKVFRSNINRMDVNKKVRKKYNLKRESIVLVAVPQYYEHGLCDKETHFSIINEMIEILSCLNYDVVLSLHPKMNRHNYEFIAFDKDNVVIVDEDLNEILPICDVFVSTYSSTLSWALLCSKKVIIIDHVLLGYTDFLSEYNLPVLNNNKELYDFLTGSPFLYDSSFYSYDKDLVNKLSPFDGECVSRIADILRCKYDE